MVSGRQVWDPVEKKLRCLRAISRSEVDDASRFVLANIVETYVELDHEDEQRFAAEIAREENTEVKEMEVRFADSSTWRPTMSAASATY
jgi:hypothetical protein